jgi:hypothetical protein
MAEQATRHLPVVALRQRIVRQLPAPDAATAPQQLPPLHQTLVPKSAFWRARVDSLRFADDSLGELRKIDSGVLAVSSQVGGLKFPSTFDVTTKMSAADAQVLDRLTTAVEKVADTLAHPRVDCARLVSLTPRAFSLVARLTTLAAHLMDRHDVSASSTLLKFDQDRELIADAHDLLEASALDDVLLPFQSAFDRDPFETLAKSPGTDRSPAVFEELQQRAGLLLAIKCMVATGGLDGPAGDWPPLEPAPAPAPAPAIPTSGVAARTRRRTS